MSPKGSKVLLVDDERMTRVPLVYLLRKFGYQVEEAEDGLAALRQFRTYRPDLVLLDISMPRMDGIEVCRRLKADPDTAAVPVIMLTALADRETVIKSVQAGARDYVTKASFSVEELVQRIERALADPLGGPTRRMSRPGAPPATAAPPAVAAEPVVAAEPKSQAVAPPAAPEPLPSVPQARVLDMDKLLAHVGDLEALPFVAAELRPVLASSESVAADVVRVIIKDQALTTALLRVANSAAYATRRPVTDLNTAVVKLGFRTVGNLALSVGILKTFLSGRGAAFDRVRFWEHSLGVGIVGRWLALAAGRQDADEAFVLGLLHDLGKVVLDEHHHEDYQGVVAAARKDRRVLVEVEKELLGLDHKLVGRKLTERWRLPPSISRAAYYHGEPWDRVLRLTGVERTEAVLIKAANVLAKALQFGDSGDDLVEEFPAGAVAALGVQPQDLEAQVEALERELRGLTLSLFTAGGKEPLAGRDIDAARGECKVLVAEPRGARSLVLPLALARAGFRVIRGPLPEVEEYLQREKPAAVVAMLDDPAVQPGQPPRLALGAADALGQMSARPCLAVGAETVLEAAASAMASAMPAMAAWPLSLGRLRELVDGMRAGS